MAKTDFLQIRIDPKLKADSQELFDSMGLTTSDAITLFLMKCLNDKGLPFQINAPGTYTTK